MQISERTLDAVTRAAKRSIHRLWRNHARSLVKHRADLYRCVYGYDVSPAEAETRPIRAMLIDCEETLDLAIASERAHEGSTTMVEVDSLYAARLALWRLRIGELMGERTAAGGGALPAG